ncbi:PREDICTED: uncharacterized protein LOC101814222 [Ficedula albicollis]|uniref:uncharacterized protein LOC101814222 n=1 Tax=Ficedula albicollis TaxID=59894 RepID=UPI0007AD901C|nr:PREDICTED: uncharacterized protein LOC101814222 [Ficedula albicollis]
MSSSPAEECRSPVGLDCCSCCLDLANRSGLEEGAGGENNNPGSPTVSSFRQLREQLVRQNLNTDKLSSIMRQDSLEPVVRDPCYLFNQGICNRNIDQTLLSILLLFHRWESPPGSGLGAGRRGGSPGPRGCQRCGPGGDRPCLARGPCVVPAQPGRGSGSAPPCPVSVPSMGEPGTRPRALQPVPGPLCGTCSCSPRAELDPDFTPSPAPEGAGVPRPSRVRGARVQYRGAAPGGNVQYRGSLCSTGGQYGGQYRGALCSVCASVCPCGPAMSTGMYQSPMEVAVYQLHNFSISFFSSLLGGDVVSVKLDNRAALCLRPLELIGSGRCAVRRERGWTGRGLQGLGLPEPRSLGARELQPPESPAPSPGRGSKVGVGRDNPWEKLLQRLALSPALGNGREQPPGYYSPLIGLFRGLLQDLVKNHLMYAVREEVEVLKEQIKELLEKNSQLERENSLLKTLASPEQLEKFQSRLPAEVLCPEEQSPAAAAPAQHSGGSAV